MLDPIGIDNFKKKSKLALSTFIKSEIRLEDSFVKNYFLRKLTFEFEVEAEVYDHFDSAVYILMQAHKHFLNSKLVISPETMNKFRIRLLYLLFKYGTKITYN